MNDIAQTLLQLPLVALLLVKLSVLLGLGWALHFAVRGNPRWRVLAWRGVMIGLPVLPLVHFLAPASMFGRSLIIRRLRCLRRNINLPSLYRRQIAVFTLLTCGLLFVIGGLNFVMTRGESSTFEAPFRLDQLIPIKTRISEKKGNSIYLHEIQFYLFQDRLFTQVFISWKNKKSLFPRRLTKDKYELTLEVRNKSGDPLNKTTHVFTQDKGCYPSFVGSIRGGLCLELGRMEDFTDADQFMICVTPLNDRKKVDRNQLSLPSVRVKVVDRNDNPISDLILTFWRQQNIGKEQIDLFKQKEDWWYVWEDDATKELWKPVHNFRGFESETAITISGFMPGKYFLSVSRKGNDFTPVGRSEFFTVYGHDPSDRNITIVLQGTCSLDITVVDDTGNSVPNAKIRLFQENQRPIGPGYTNHVVQADKNGKLMLKSLMPGVYWIEARHYRKANYFPPLKNRTRVVVEEGKLNKATVTTSDRVDESSCRLRLKERVKILRQGEILKFGDIQVQLVAIQNNRIDNDADENIYVIIRGPMEPQSVDIPENHLMTFGEYQVKVEDIVLDRELSARITLIDRFMFDRKYGNTSQDRVVRDLREEDELRFQNINVRLLKVKKDKVDDATDRSAEFMINAPKFFHAASIKEYCSESIEDYVITAQDILPADSLREKGSARIKFGYRPRDKAKMTQSGTPNVRDVTAAAVPEKQNTEASQRILRFPKAHLLGVLKIRDRAIAANWRMQIKDGDIVSGWQTGWMVLDDAQGDVPVPDNKDVALFIGKDGAEDLSPLSQLHPDDLQYLHIDGNLSDSELNHLENLSGLRGLSMRKTKIAAPGLVFLKGMRNLEELSIRLTGHNKNGLKYLSHPDSLLWLDIAGGHTDEIAAHIKPLKNLRYLSLNGSGVTDISMAVVNKFNMLEALTINSSQISNDGLKQLTGLSRLQHLDIGDNHITEAGFEYLTRYERLQFLRVTPSSKKPDPRQLPWNEKQPISSAGMAQLAKLKNLTHLCFEFEDAENLLGDLSNLKKLKIIELKAIGDEDVAQLNRFPALECVKTDYGHLSVKAIPMFAAMPKLKHLNIKHLRGDVYWINELEKAAPHCRVDVMEMNSRYPGRRYSEEKEDWERKFVAIYRLDKDQYLRRIAPPFIPERTFYVGGSNVGEDRSSMYYRFTLQERREVKREYEGQTFFNMQSAGLTTRDGGWRSLTLKQTLNLIIGLNDDQFDGPDELLLLYMPGDWVVRQPGDETNFIQDLEKILLNEFNLPVQFEKKLSAEGLGYWSISRKNTSEIGHATRVLRFPADRSTGRLRIRNRSLATEWRMQNSERKILSGWLMGWEDYGKAQGEVSIPRDKDATLIIGIDGSTAACMQTASNS